MFIQGQGRVGAKNNVKLCHSLRGKGPDTIPVEGCLLWSRAQFPQNGKLEKNKSARRRSWRPNQSAAAGLLHGPLCGDTISVILRRFEPLHQDLSWQRQEPEKEFLLMEDSQLTIPRRCQSFSIILLT